MNTWLKWNTWFSFQQKTNPNASRLRQIQLFGSDTFDPDIRPSGNGAKIGRVQRSQVRGLISVNYKKQLFDFCTSLKWNLYSFREDPYSPQSICPSNDKSWDLVTDIINQVADMHPDSTWLHIGKMIFVLNFQYWISSTEGPVLKCYNWRSSTEIVVLKVSKVRKPLCLPLGCDEVYQLGQCPICTERLTKWNEMGKERPDFLYKFY